MWTMFAMFALGALAGVLWDISIGAKWEREDMLDESDALGEARAEFFRLNQLIDAYQIRANYNHARRLP